MRRMWLAALLLILPHAASAAAQTPDGSFRGVVLDTSGAPVPGARVVVTPDGGRATQAAVTDERGEFSLPVAPGTCRVRVEAAGFLAASQHGACAQEGPRAFVLQVAGPRETVEVSAPSGYRVPATASATKTLTPLLDVPQSVTVVTRELIADQMMTSVGDVVRYVPGIIAHQGENNRDQVIIRGNSSSADFFVNGVRDDVQYYRDLYNLDRVEALKGPNALIFGRGGGGGVINRVVKEAGFQPLREVTLQGGSHGARRVTADLDQPVTESVALRLNGMYETAGSFRHGVDLERGGFNPTLTFSPTIRTRVVVSYEHLRDDRVADRGITSFRGRPADVATSTFYGNPDDSRVRLRANLGTVAVEQQFGRARLNSRTLIAGYDRFYQNYVPGAASADGTTVALSAYSNAASRTNVFHQSDVTYVRGTGPLTHTLLAGAELGRQATDNFRRTGYFHDAVPMLPVPFEAPTVRTPVTFRQSATDADNHVTANVAAVFAQDQVQVSRRLQLIGGVRFDRFDLEYHNNRTGQDFARRDDLVSPRAGLVVKPIPPLSIYTSYGLSYLPSAGDQFSSLTSVTQQLKPEKFANYEVGAKWDVRGRLALTTAVYRLDRTNTRATDPGDPGRIVQTGGQRTNGYELGLNGQVLPGWSVAGGYAYQDAFVTSATLSARQGAQVGQVPHHTLSLWNNVRLHRRVSAALGLVHRSAMFAAIDNTVVLDGYTRADAAAYLTVRKGLRLQANVENLFNRRYFANADTNTNLSPGAPRQARVGVVVGF